MNTANKHQTGLSLIELMVAIVIGSLLLLGAASLMINNKRIYQTQDQLGRMQESARFAIQRMFHDISMAGYFGCTGKGGDSIKNHLKASLPAARKDYEDYDTSEPVEGFDNATGNWQPSGRAFARAPAAGTDGITVRSMSGMSYRLKSPVTSQTADVEVAIPADVELDKAIEKDDYVMLADCKGADIFQATGVTSAGRTLTLEHAASGDNKTANLRQLYENYENNDETGQPVAKVAKLNISRYYIAASSKGPHPNGDARFSLYQNNTELVEGVRDMQVLYGIDTDNDANATPNQYVAAAAGINWSNVVSVKITLTFEPTDRNYADSADDPEWVYTTTIRIRNNTGAVI